MQSPKCSPELSLECSLALVLLPECMHVWKPTQAHPLCFIADQFLIKEPLANVSIPFMLWSTLAFVKIIVYTCNLHEIELNQDIYT